MLQLYYIQIVYGYKKIMKSLSHAATLISQKDICKENRTGAERQMSPELTHIYNIKMLTL